MPKLLPGPPMTGAKQKLSEEIRSEAEPYRILKVGGAGHVARLLETIAERVATLEDRLQRTEGAVDQLASCACGPGICQTCEEAANGVLGESQS